MCSAIQSESQEELLACAINPQTSSNGGKYGSAVKILAGKVVFTILFIEWNREKKVGTTLSKSEYLS